jgi:hypothetical protein
MGVPGRRGRRKVNVLTVQLHGEVLALSRNIVLVNDSHDGSALASVGTGDDCDAVSDDVKVAHVSS